MKITKAQLKKLIKEEIETMEEAEHDDRFLTVAQARAKDQERLTQLTGESEEARLARSRAARDLVDLADSLRMAGKSIGRHPGLNSTFTKSSVRDLPEILQGLKKAVADVEDMIRAYNS